MYICSITFCLFPVPICFFLSRLQLEGLSDYCVDRLLHKIDVKEENVSSLLGLVLVYEQLAELRDKLHIFIAGNWVKLSENGLLEEILQDERFTNIGIEAVTKYHGMIE